VNSYFTRIVITFTGLKALLMLTMQEELLSANDVKNVQPTYVLYLTFCLPVKQDLPETALPTSLILMCGQMKTPMLFCS
jgi:hypothetical protein